MTSQSTRACSFTADALPTFPREPQPTNFSERNVLQKFASLDFQASYALFSSATISAFAGQDISDLLTVFASFADAFPLQAVKMKAAATVKLKCLSLDIFFASKIVVWFGAEVMVYIVFVFCFLWNGGNETRTRDHYCDSVASTGFAVTYRTAETAKLRGIHKTPLLWAI